MAYRHILMATGGSDHSLLAEAEARRLAKALGSQLTLLGVIPLSAASLDSAYPYDHDRVASVLREAEARCREEGLAVEVVLKTGGVGPTIVETADVLGCDLIVLGRRRLSLLAIAVLGSVSDYVVRHAPKSILIVQPS